MLRTLSQIWVNEYKSPPTLVMLGSWVGILARDLQEEFNTARIYGIDKDPQCQIWSEQLNCDLVADNWSYKGVVADVDSLYLADLNFITGNEAIQIKPDIIVNTSAEHMSSRWFSTTESDQLVVLQTNDYCELPEHINTCDCLAEVCAKYPMKDILFRGSMVLPTYTRYMVIGYPY